MDYRTAIERDTDDGFWFCRECAANGYSVPAVELHHIVHRSIARPGTEQRQREDSASNLISLCHRCHIEANATDKKRLHLELLQAEGYEYESEPWAGLLRMGNAR